LLSSSQTKDLKVKIIEQRLGTLQTCEENKKGIMEQLLKMQVDSTHRHNGHNNQSQQGKG